MQTVLQSAIDGLTTPSTTVEWLMVAAVIVPMLAIFYRAYNKDVKLGELIKPVPVTAIAGIAAILSWVLSSLTVSMFLLPFLFIYLIWLGVTIGAVGLLGARFVGLDIAG